MEVNMNRAACLPTRYVSSKKKLPSYKKITKSIFFERCLHLIFTFQSRCSQSGTRIDYGAVHCMLLCTLHRVDMPLADATLFLV